MGKRVTYIFLETSKVSYTTDGSPWQNFNDFLPSQTRLLFFNFLKWLKNEINSQLSQPTEERQVETGITDEAETEDSPAFLPRQPFVCQSTPYPKCANHNILSCSSTKKARISPKFSRSGIGKYFRSAATNLTRAVNNPANQSHFGHSLNSSLSDNSRINHCEHCDSHQKRIKTPSYEYLAHSRIKHSCCLHNPESNEKDADCFSDNEVFDESTIYETMSNILANHEKYANSLNNLMCKNHCTNAGSEEKCRHHTSPGPRFSGREQDFHQTHKRCSSCTDDLPSCSRRLAPAMHQCHDHFYRSHSHVSCEEEDHPLLFNESPSETPEVEKSVHYCSHFFFVTWLFRKMKITHRFAFIKKSKITFKFSELLSISEKKWKSCLRVSLALARLMDKFEGVYFCETKVKTDNFPFTDETTKTEWEKSTRNSHRLIARL